MRYPYLLIITVICFLCMTFNVSAQEDSTMLSIQKQVFPQEKIHLMTDAECYMPGDTIWMRLWIQDGETLKDSKIGSRYAYVDLRSVDDTLVHRVKIEEREGRFAGQMILPDTVTTGNYRLFAYTMYMLGTSVNTFFQKPVYIISPKDVASGKMPKQLLTEYKGGMDTLLTSSVVRRADTLTRVTLSLPDSTWFAISITDDRYSPVNQSYNIAYRLPRVRNLFTRNSVSRQKEIITPVYPIEQTPILFGSLYLKSKKEQTPRSSSQLVIADAHSGKLYTTVTDSVGGFTLDVSDLDEQSCLVFTPTSVEENVDLISINLLDSVPLRYRIPTQLDFFTTLEDVENQPAYENYKQWALHRYFEDAKRINENAITPDITSNRYLDNATEYIFEEDFMYMLQSDNKTPASKVRDVLRLFPNVILNYSTALYNSDRNASSEIRFIVGDHEEDELSFSSGLVRYQKSMDFPLSLVESVEFIDANTASIYFPNPAKPDSPIIHITIKKDVNDKKNSSSYSKIAVLTYLGKQIRLRHNNLNIRTDEPQTVYWNPECYSGSKGSVSIDVPIPNNVHTTYTVRAEGVEPSGNPISLIYKIFK